MSNRPVASGCPGLLGGSHGFAGLGHAGAETLLIVKPAGSPLPAEHTPQQRWSPLKSSSSAEAFSRLPLRQQTSCPLLVHLFDCVSFFAAFAFSRQLCPRELAACGLILPSTHSF